MLPSDLVSQIRQTTCNIARTVITEKSSFFFTRDTVTHFFLSFLVGGVEPPADGKFR